MEGLCGSYTLRCDDAAPGTLTVKKEGLFYIFEAELAPCGEAVRVYADCGGVSKEIGCVTPCGGGKARMKKRLSSTALKEMGIDKIDGFFAADELTSAPEQPSSHEPEQPESDGWQPCEDPGALFSDPDARNSCRDVKGALMSRGEAGLVKLALPLEFGKPFLPMPIFTYGSWKKLGGRGYLVFSIRDGRPVI